MIVKPLLLCLLFAAAPLTMVSADSGVSTTGTTTPPADTQGQRMERFRKALEQLHLTEAQKAQIKQIRATATDHRERRRQIMAVLTPDQREKLKQMIQEHRQATQPGETPGAS